MHNPDNYLKITKHFIYVGHIHLPSRYKKIISSGSLDRLAHGEEGKKCWTKSYIYDNPEDDVVEFIENRLAYPYKTLDVTGLTADEVETVVNEYMAKVQHGYIRIIANKEDIGSALYQRYKETYKQYGWTFKDAGEKSKSQRVAEIASADRQKLTLPKLTRDNLQHLLMDRIKTTHPELVEQCRSILCEVL